MAETVFDVQLVVEDGVTELRFTGEFDLAGMPTAEGALERALEPGEGRMVIDLSELEFIDSSGLRFMVLAQSRCAETRRPLAIRPGNEVVQRVFALTRLDTMLPFES